MDDEFEIEVSVQIPQDADGFIRRECPHCEQQFKWHDGPANEVAENFGAAETYYCPLCGEPAGLDSWYTTEQLEVAQQMAMPHVMGIVEDGLESMFRGVKGMTYERGNDILPDESEPLVEPNDMMIVASPCHSFEPVKIPADHPARLHCLLCGSAFGV
ncbi:hypothetical protein [Aeromicrobium sp. Root472D3]|uniref:hypothetical protein n=1 Tax=Aeromicrobium sp. Root472D3 TaxID=1736540 RepID=UPI00191102B0|nr:hypothetical protein [Aeromicrobium sp. Root472D3]